jgi:ferredoxin
MSRSATAARVPEITSRCTGCGRCVAACAPHVLWLEARGWAKTAVLHAPAGCTGCSECAVVCPFGAIRMRRPPAPPRLA